MKAIKVVKVKFHDLKRYLPSRKNHSHKGDGGKVLIVAGGKKYLGAGILAAQAATRSGAGHTHLMTEMGLAYPWAKFPDFILHSIAVRPLKDFTDKVIAFGPGLGTEDKKMKLLLYLLKSKCPRVVIDADGLTLLSKLKASQFKLPPSWILTPHQGELARLLGISLEEVLKNPKKALIAAYHKFGCHIYLKGHQGMLLTPSRSGIQSSPILYTFRFGTKALAKAGTGDVLLGIIAAFLAQGLRSDHAVLLAVYTHGLSAKIWEKKGQDHLGLRPKDVVEYIPKSLHEMRKLKKV